MKLKDAVPAEERRFGYLSILEGVALSEETNQQWLHAAPVGEYRHPLYGKINFTTEKIKRFAQNVKDGVRGIDIAIDYSHRASDKAAGWVKDADARTNGLWLLVEWTEAAAAAIRNKEFRYFSPEFVDQYKDAKSGEMYKDVLLGGGLTNRPFLKDLIPVNLSEVFTEEDEQTPEPVIEQEDDSVNEFLKKLREQLGLPEDADEQQVLAAVGSSGGGDGSTQMSELITQNRQLAEQVDMLVAAQRLTEVRYTMKEWEAGTSQGAKFALPPALHETAEELLTSGSKTFSEGFTKFVNGILETGLVKLGEEGTTNPERHEKPEEETNEEVEPAAIKAFNDLIQSIEKDNPEMTVGDAIEEAARREPQVFEEYRKAAYSFREDS